MIRIVGSWARRALFSPLVAVLFPWLAMFSACGAAQAQANPDAGYFSRANTFGILTQYSNDSSHILLGIAENRKLLNFGGVYSRRLFENGAVNWQYAAEVLPMALESDPVDTFTVTYTAPVSSTNTETGIGAGACHTDSGSGSFVEKGVTYTFTYTNACSRRWTIGEGMSPIGFQWNFFPRRKIQPILLAHGGYMYSTKPIPVADSGSFNFTFDFGVGLEIYRSRTQSVRLDYRFHHISDHYTTNDNPGIDNGLFSVTYSFGR